MIEIPLERPYTPEYVEAELSEAGFWRAFKRVVRILSVIFVGLFFRTFDRWHKPLIKM